MYRAMPLLGSLAGSAFLIVRWKNSPDGRVRLDRWKLTHDSLILIHRGRDQEEDQQKESDVSHRSRIYFL